MALVHIFAVELFVAELTLKFGVWNARIEPVMCERAGSVGQDP